VTPIAWIEMGAVTISKPDQESPGRGKEILNLTLWTIAIIVWTSLACNRLPLRATMLTAHSLTPQDVFKSYNEGAASYIPKDAMSKIAVYLNDILEAKKHNKSLWWRWGHHFSRFFKGEFGPNWEDQYKEYKGFWEEYFKK
jgi:hypothetical protein